MDLEQRKIRTEKRRQYLKERRAKNIDKIKARTSELYYEHKKKRDEVRTSLTPELQSLYKEEKRLEIKFQHTFCPKEQVKIKKEYGKVVARLQELNPPSPESTVWHHGITDGEIAGGLTKFKCHLRGY